MVHALSPNVPSVLRNTLDPELIQWLEENFTQIFQLLAPGHEISGTFTTVDGKTITVADGIVTGITP